MEHLKTKQKFVIEITQEETRILQGLVQNCKPDESDEMKQNYLHLFVGLSKLLGYNIKDVGAITKG